MNASGVSSHLIAARNALLDALQALDQHRMSVIVVGAQAIYLHTGPLVALAVAELTFDGDLALDMRSLGPAPLLDSVMSGAGFELDPAGQPGSWRNSAGVQVDLMVPEALAGEGGRRGARIPPHSKRSARRVTGLEAAIVEHAPMPIGSLAPRDRRVFIANVAAPSALLVAKLHKLADRAGDDRRLDNKDAHDIYRLLVATKTISLAVSVRRLLSNELAARVTSAAMDSLERLFILGDPPLGAAMAGEAERIVGNPEVVMASVTVLARDLMDALRD